MLNREQIAAIQNVTLGYLFDLGDKTVESVGKLAALNNQWTCTTLVDMFELVQKSLSSKEHRNWLALQDNFAERMTERVLTYSRQAVDIVLVTQTEFARIVQVQGSACRRQVQTMVEDVAKNVPVTIALNSAISAADSLCESLRSAGRQEVEVAKSNLEVGAEALKSTKPVATNKTSN
ncbi:TIGR01841 family phasin [Paraburkholderia sp. BR10954]|uniref:TIGR01841 family phasin n=1 Tax=Paraburkholderia sp. BR10954 TaxID=3236995 RepID=UPI0034D1FC9D